MIIGLQYISRGTGGQAKNGPLLSILLTGKSICGKKVLYPLSDATAGCNREYKDDHEG